MSKSSVFLEEQNFQNQNHALLLQYSDLLNQLKAENGASRTMMICMSSACIISLVYTTRYVRAGTLIVLILLSVANCFPRSLCWSILSPTLHEALYFFKCLPKFYVIPFSNFRWSIVSKLVSFFQFSSFSLQLRLSICSNPASRLDFSMNCLFNLRFWYILDQPVQQNVLKQQKCSLSAPLTMIATSLL